MVKTPRSRGGKTPTGFDAAGKGGELKPQCINPREIHSSYEDLSRRVPDVSKANSILGWQAKTGLDMGVRKTIEFFEAEINRGEVK